MPGDTGLILWLASATACFLLALAARIDAWRRRAPAPPTRRDVLEPVTVLLPVRDEELDLPGCLDTLRQVHGVVELRVVDDGSSDATPDLLAEAVRRDPRIRALDSGPLPAGWRGKTHALAVGARGVTTPWILLTDADTRHHPEGVARAQAAAAAWELDAVSVAGRQRVHGLGEALVTPPVFALLDAALGDWKPATHSGGQPVANGQFILLRTAALEACGGFSTIRDDVLDDIALVRRLRAAGFRTGFLRAPELLEVRMYRGFVESFKGWRRILGGLYCERPGAAWGAVGIQVAAIGVLLTSLIAAQWVAAAILWGGGVAASALVRAGARTPVVAALLFPLDALLLAALVLAARRDTRRGALASWKGRPMALRPRGPC